LTWAAAAVAHRSRLVLSKHLDRQVLERLGVPLQVLADRRAERLIASSNLWGRILDEPLRRLHPAGADPIPIALARARPMLVVLPSDRIACHPIAAQL